MMLWLKNNSSARLKVWIIIYLIKINVNKILQVLGKTVLREKKNIQVDYTQIPIYSTLFHLPTFWAKSKVFVQIFLFFYLLTMFEFTLTRKELAPVDYKFDGKISALFIQPPKLNLHLEYVAFFGILCWCRSLDSSQVESN